MTPKEHADELINLFEHETYHQVKDGLANQCAIICVDRIIHALQNANPNYEKETYWHPIDFYRQVKEELEKP
jgi:hypothetical protein